MKLVQIDLNKSVSPHEHPDIKNDQLYVIKEQDCVLRVGYAGRVWFGITFNMGNWYHQFDPPGKNKSRLLEIWEIVDEELREIE